MSFHQPREFFNREWFTISRQFSPEPPFGSLVPQLAKPHGVPSSHVQTPSSCESDAPM